MERRGMNERIRNLRKQSTGTAPHLYMERARLYTEAYRLYEGRVSTPELRALAFDHFLRHKSLSIGEGELIVGEKGGGPQSAPTFPELCCHSLADMRTLNDRPLISFSVSDEDLRLQEEDIIPYWQGRTMRDQLLCQMTPEWKDCYESGIFTEFMEQRGPGHTAGGDIFYRKGFLDLQADVQRALDALDGDASPAAVERRQELRAMSLCCDAIIHLGVRYASLARTLAAREENPVRRAELLQIAENCDRVPARAPQTYWQALQMYWFVHIGVTTEIRTRTNR